MRKKKFLIPGLVLFGVMVVAGMGFVGCHRPPMFCGGEFCGKEFPEHVLEKIDAAVEELELTKTQTTQYREIRTRVEKQLVEVGAQRKAFFDKVKMEMDNEKPDLNVISGLVKSHVEHFPNRVDMFLEDFMEFYGVLDEKQKAVITTFLKDKFKKFEAFKALMSS